MGIFEKYLSVWVFLAIVIGQSLGLVFPQQFQQIAIFEYHNINLVIAILIWAMILPMMLQIDFTKIKDLSRNTGGLFLTLSINWLIKPFTMFFFRDFVYVIYFQQLYSCGTGSSIYCWHDFTWSSSMYCDGVRMEPFNER